MAHVYLENRFDLGDLADQIVHSFGMASSLTYVDIVRFFAEVDGRIADWDFTKLAADYFNTEMNKIKENT